jgi:two-component system sensor histidine kinase/response regulator
VNISARVSNWSLRKKLISIIMLSSMVCVLVTLTVLLISSLYSRHQEALRRLTSVADVLAQSGQAALMFSDQAEAARLLASLAEHEAVSAAWLVSMNGTVLASWNRHSPEQRAAATAMPTDYRVRALRLNSDFLSRSADLYRPVTKDAEQIGYVLLKADFTGDWLHELADSGRALGAAAVALVVVLVLAMRLQGLITRPFAELADAARVIARNKTYGLRVKERTQDEIGELVREFNNMLKEIQRRDAELIRRRDLLEEEVAARTVELVQSRDQAEAASRFKSMFLANMSHEIRTPMNAIIGLSELAIGPETPPRLRDYLGKIRTSSEALLSIINDILDFSKVEAGRMEIEAEEFDLEALLENVSNLFIVQAEEKGLELAFEICPEVPRVVRGDALRLGQVMNNVVGNAVKFTERGEVHVRVCQVAEEPGFSTISFRVQDTGIGMGEEQMAQLFQPFTQGDGSITRRFGGSGLGLAISKRLVDMMGGDFAVESETGAGSTFSFTLRLPVVAYDAIVRPSGFLRGARVLIVDDLEISRLVLRKTFVAWGFEVAEAVSGEEALATLADATASGRPCELVVLDWKMPGMDGVQLARAIREQVRAGQIGDTPLMIMVTAFAKERLLKEAEDVSLDAILVKPVLPSALMDAIVRLQSGKTGHAAEPERMQHTAPVLLRGARILLVEDHEINQMVARAFLENAGMEVTVANNGQEGVLAVRKGHFDAVLMDLHMPVMDGFEAARHIRQDPRLRDLPVIAMTAAAMAQDREACYAAGINDHVAKPILPQELLQILVKWVRPVAQGDTAVTLSPHEALRVFEQDTPGFNFTEVLTLLNGDREKLRRLLLRFAGEFADTSEKLNDLVVSGKPAEAVALAHKIRGAAANLGAAELGDAAARLEEGVLAGTGDAALMQFDAELSRALTVIEGLASPGGVDAAGLLPACGACRVHSASELFGRLRLLLDGNDFVPHDLMQALKTALPCHDMQERLSEIEKHVRNFNYVSAQQAVAQLACLEGHDFRERML